MHELLNILRQKQGTAIDFHRELMSAVPAVNPEHGGTGEESKAILIEKLLRNNGLCRIQRMDCSDNRVPRKLRPNLLAHYNPPNSEYTLWIVTHMDVCASGPAEQWESDPFILRVDGDKLYGRGVEDNNQGIVSALLLLDAVKECRTPPPVGLGLICTCAGLTCYEKGIGLILSKNEKLFKPDDFIVVPDYGSPSGDQIEIGEKQNIWLQIDVQGKAYHAGFDAGANSFEAAALFISQLESIRNSLSTFNPIFFHPTSTITPTYSKNNSTGLNHVASQYTFYLDIRIIPDDTLEPIMKELRLLSNKIGKQHNVRVVLKCIEKTPDAPVTSENASVIKALSNAISEELNIMPKYVGVGGCTMASFIRALKLPVAVWSIQNATKNQINEHISVAAQLNQTCVLARLLYKFKFEAQTKNLFQNITKAEFTIVQLVGKGLSNEQISIHLNSSINTVRTHLKSLYRKTKAKNRQELTQLFKININKDI